MTHLTTSDSGSALDAARRALADRLRNGGAMRTDALEAAVAAVPREVFLQPGVFLPTEDGRWGPATPSELGPAAWAELAYSDEQSLVTQVDGHLTVADVTAPIAGFPTASSTTPVTVISMIEDLEAGPGMSILELGTGTGYSTALLSAVFGEDLVTSVEVDPALSSRAEAALEQAGWSPWTYAGDGLLGLPYRAPYDRVIATFSVRRIPYAWVRQTRPGGIILATVGSWAYGSGLARLTVEEDGTATGRLIRRSSFMPARAHAPALASLDLGARTAYADTERPTRMNPGLLERWMPAFLAQTAAPGTQMIHAVGADGDPEVHLFDIERESFAVLTPSGEEWTVRQGGPVAIWDVIEDAVARWEAAGSPDIDDVALEVTEAAHTYQFNTDPGLCWVHQVAP